MIDILGNITAWVHIEKTCIETIELHKTYKKSEKWYPL